MSTPDKEESSSLDEKICQASSLYLEHDEESIIRAISQLNEFLMLPELTPVQKVNTQVNLAKAYQHRGDHSSALDTLNAIDKTQNTVPIIYIMNIGATSYVALGLIQEACNIFSEIIMMLDKSDMDYMAKGGIYLEAGKAFRANKDDKHAVECWEKAAELFKCNGDSDDMGNIEHYLRAKSNLATVKLYSEDNVEQEEAIQILEETSENKMRIGDIEGLANNYCNLGLYYWKNKRYERAIAYLRKDLFLSRKVGDLRAIASTLGNLSQLYTELKQLTSARNMLQEAKQIGEKLKDIHLLEVTKHQLARVDMIGKEAGKKKEKIGLHADCACGSGKEYQTCCGQADFEPIDIPIIFGGISEDIEDISKKAKELGVQPSRLDHILRQTDKVKERLAWTRMEGKDGWIKISELPDASNMHLNSSNILAQESESEPGSITKPLSCVILSVCAVEAFINQVAYFLNDIKYYPEAKYHNIPPELEKDVMSFQRYTELTQKWDILGKELCGNNWPPPISLWNEFKDLIHIRNELVHFKMNEYEQVVPPSKEVHDTMKRVPKSIKTRDVPHAWPIRLLTPSFAKWCVNIASTMIEYFRNSYSHNRFG